MTAMGLGVKSDCARHDHQVVRSASRAQVPRGSTELLDCLVDLGQERGAQRHTELRRCAAVDDQLVVSGLVHGELTGGTALQDAINVVCALHAHGGWASSV